MSDVERICHRNHQRVRWADEYTDRPVQTPPDRKRREKAKETARTLRTASLACAAACGVGTTFLAIGICDLNLAALVTGAVVVTVFLLFGFACEAKAEEITTE